MSGGRGCEDGEAAARRGGTPHELRRHLEVCRCRCGHAGFGDGTLPRSGGDQGDGREYQVTTHEPFDTFIDRDKYGSDEIGKYPISNIPPCPRPAVDRPASAPVGHAPPPRWGRASAPPAPPPPPPPPPLSRETSFVAPPGAFTTTADWRPPSVAGSCSCSSSSGESTRGGARGPWCVCLVVCAALATLSAGLGLPLALNGGSSTNGDSSTGDVLTAATAEQRLEAVRRLLRDTPLVDGHNDLPWNVRKFAHNRVSQLNLSSLHEGEPWANSPWAHTDIPRLRAGCLGAQFWSAYVPCGSQYKDAVQLALEQIDVVRRLVERHPAHLGLARTAADIRSEHKRGRIASLIGVEGGHSLGNSLAVLRMLYALGARYLTLTHSCDTPWATGSDTNKTTGLTDFGRSVIKEMNRLGMIVDLSHTSAYTSRAAIDTSTAPVIFSHSGARAQCNSTRNVPDDILKLVAKNGGLVMVDFYSKHVACQDNATMEDVVRHINHVRKVAGVEHVGIGAGYDGINVTPVGLEDVSRYPHLFAQLLADPLWSEHDISLLAGANFLRVFEKVEAIRDQWKLDQVLPEEDPVPQIRHECSSGS